MLEIKRVQLDYANLLQDVAKKTFLETFSKQNNLNDMANYVEQNFSIDKLKKRYRIQALFSILLSQRIAWQGT